MESALPGQDFKTSLQEYTHARYKAPPSYHLMAESGPGHARHFQVEVRLQEVPLAQGEGRTKKEAEQQAARRALEVLQGENAPGADSAV
jgi:ribonuclease-3